MPGFEPRISRPQREVLTTILHTPGEAGYRSQYLSHAKRALYHLSYIPISYLTHNITLTKRKHTHRPNLHTPIHHNSHHTPTHNNRPLQLPLRARVDSLHCLPTFNHYKSEQTHTSCLVAHPTHPVSSTRSTGAPTPPVQHSC